jgi:RNA 2',3'-cyclic 3'-phosphodiesterase
MPRLFSGLKLPDRTVERIQTLRGDLEGARWIEPQDYHITLRFAGDVDRRTGAEFADALSRIMADPFAMEFGELGCFGGDHPRALYIEIRPTPALFELQRANERAARQAGLASEGRKYTPHLTIARLKGTRPTAVARFIEAASPARWEPVPVVEFMLFSSRPVTGGGPYVVEEVFPLGADYSEDAAGEPDLDNSAEEEPSS